MCNHILLGLLFLLTSEISELLNFDRLKAINMHQLFEPLLTDYMVPFELATVLLLATIVAVVSMSKTSNKREVQK